jgi:hypothetical protein
MRPLGLGLSLLRVASVSFVPFSNRVPTFIPRGTHKFLQMTDFSSSSSSASTSCYVDVHAHLIHEQFKGEEDAIADKCKNHGLEYVICNGLEPVSNRATLELSHKHSHILPALGIYPLEAACTYIVEGENWKHPFPPPPKFDVDAEIAFIDSLAAEKKIVALGECGLDKHYLTDEVTFAEQERVLRLLMRVRLGSCHVSCLSFL